jgi:hypothetical protein
MAFATRQPIATGFQRARASQNAELYAAENLVGELLAFFLASERLSAARSTKPLSVS